MRGLSDPSTRTQSRATTAVFAERIIDPSSDLPPGGHLLPQGEKGSSKLRAVLTAGAVSLAALALAACAAGGGAGGLDRELAAADSATAVLQRRCDAQGRAPAGTRIVARRVPGAEKPLTPEDRALLGAAADEPIVYRRVELLCGTEVFSRADNWYRPGRLTAEMNRTLTETETPFGVAVRAMGATRRTLSRDPLRGGEGVLRHRAVLVAADGTPFSLVVETYAPAAAR